MPFIDGEPIDASKLGALETELNKLRAEMPKIGVSTTSISVSSPSVANSGNPVIVPTNVPQVFGGITSSLTLSPNTYQTFPINYSAAKLNALPKAIILTPIYPKVVGSLNEASILSGSVTTTGATGQIFHRSDATKITGIQYYFMVITF